LDYLAYSGNSIVRAKLPGASDIYYAPPPIEGLAPASYPDHIRRAVEQPLDSPPLRQLVNATSKVLIAFDDNCQPFPLTAPPDFRQSVLETLLPLLAEYGVQRENIQLISPSRCTAR